MDTDSSDKMSTSVASSRFDSSRETTLCCVVAFGWLQTQKTVAFSKNDGEQANIMLNSKE